MTRIWAHRGASHDMPENTLEAFEAAIRQGADGIELDVHLSSDGELIVAHDETVDRVSDGGGYIKDKTLAELKALDFSKTRPHAGVCRVPTLGEVYDLIKPTGLFINVELKTAPIPYPGIEQAALRLTEEFGLGDRVIYSSFNHYSLTAARAINPLAKIGLLYHLVLVDPWDYAAKLGADALHPMFLLLQIPGYMQKCRELGIAVNAWTVDDPAHIKWMASLGVDAIITNRPGAARAVLNDTP